MGDDDTRDVLLEEARGDVPASSEVRKASRLFDDAKVLREWPALSVEETAKLRGERAGVAAVE